MKLNLFLDKIKELPDLKKIIEGRRAAGEKIVFANGCFDILHVGHVRYLSGAKEYGDVLVVGVNADESVKALKGEGRPALNEEQRMVLVAAMECVDYVVLFREKRVDNLLLELKPDFHAKGTDYTEDSVPEKEIVASYGGRVIITGDPKDHSSSTIIEDAKKRTQ